MQAVVADLAPYMALLQSYGTPKLQLPARTVIDQGVERRVVELIRQEGTTWPPAPVPDLEALMPTDEQLSSDVVASGIDAPVDPLAWVGLSVDDDPAPDVVETAMTETVRSNAPLARRLFQRSRIRQEAQQQVEQFNGTRVELTNAFNRQRDQFAAAFNQHQAAARSRAEKNISDLRAEAERAARRFHELDGDVREEMDTAVRLATEAYQAFLDGETVVSTIVLQTVFSDNFGVAAPIGIDGTDLLVLMTIPPVEEAVWPEDWVFGPPLKVKKLTKAAMKERYSVYLRCFSLATAHEALVTQPYLQRVRVVVLPEAELSRSFLTQRIESVFTVTRNDIVPLTRACASNTVTDAHRFIAYWNSAITSNDEMRAYDMIEDGERRGLPEFRHLVQLALNVLETVGADFDGYSSTPRKDRPTLASVLDEDSSIDGDLAVAQNLDDNDLDEVRIPASSINEPWFWIYCRLTAANWSNGDRDPEDLLDDAFDLAAYLTT